MVDSIPALAILGGFWGQLIEYWPFTLTVGITLGYIVVAFGADIVFGHRRNVPAGAEPRVVIEVDPYLKARNRFRTGIYLVRLGVAVGVVMAIAIAYVGHNPLSIGSEFGLTQATDDATAMGTRVGLAAAVAAVLAAFWIRTLPLVLIGAIDIALIVVAVSPPIFNGQLSSLGLTAFLMVIPLSLAAIGTGIACIHYTDALRPRGVIREPEPAQAR